jgi:hypothetical protein
MKRTQSNGTAQTMTVILCWAIVETIALVNSYVFNLKGASVDAERFVDYAIIWSKNGHFEFVTNAEFFIQFLGIIFWLFTPSEFLATQFGILSMIVAIVYLMKLGKAFDVTIPPWAIVAFFLWPSVLSRVTTTLREPYLILFTIMLCYFLAQYKIHERTADLVKLLAVSIIAFLFHKAYAIFFVISSGYILFFVMKVQGSLFKSNVAIIRIAIILLVGAIIGYVLLYSSNVRGLKPLIAVMTGDSEYITQVIDYKSSREFRTTYDASLDFSSFAALIISVPKTYIYYMFSPFPWQITNAVDMLAALEGLFRLGALYLFAYYAMLKGRFPRAFTPIAILILSLTFIWAAGTSNYGTASRHHITTNWFFLLVYVVWFQKIVGQPISRIKIGRQTSSAI